MSLSCESLLYEYKSTAIFLNLDIISYPYNPIQLPSHSSASLVNFSKELPILQKPLACLQYQYSVLILHDLSALFYTDNHPSSLKGFLW